ncbi:MAG TPA: hypothetical protein DEW39_04220 [Brevibacterium sp.]|nr:hypothetical protein [Brevibacterium sp.]
MNEKKRLDRVANADQVSARVAQWRDANPSMVEAKERKRRERQRIATERANRNFTRWTPEEDELVLTWVGGDLELAFALGRGYHSIASRRHNLRKCGQISTSTNHKEN